MAGEIFISYRRADQARARLLHELMKQRGVDAWYDALLDAGADWRHRTAEALEKAPIFVLLFSKAASASDDISKELAAATFSKKTVIPVRIENIKPSGAFLYELASRNWFDAFEETETRFEELADKLAALVKGGPAAEAAASSLGAPKAPMLKPAVKQLLKQPWVTGGIAATAVAVVAAIAFFATRGPAQPATAAQNERAAFFGFTAADKSELSTQIAGVATDETFSAMTAMNLQTAARGETLGVALNEQLDRAAALDARYAFGGDVRTSGDHVTVNIRLDDSITRATLWQSTVSGDAAQRESLPVRAAARATNLLECLIQVRPDMVREDAGALALVTHACGFVDVYDRQTIELWRDVLEVAPRSARAEVGLASSYWFQSLIANDAERPALLRELGEAANRILAFEPNHSGARVALARFDIGADRPLADILFRIDLAVHDWIGARDGNSASLRLLLLSGVGRNAEAARIGRSDANASPFNAAVQLQYGMALANAGETAAGLRVLESSNRRLARNWPFLAAITILADQDLAPVVAAAPSDVTPEMIACMETFSVALRSTAAKAAAMQGLLACARADHIPRQVAIPLLAQVGDVEAVLAFAEEMVSRVNPFGFTMSASGLFSPASRPLRADPRFLPLVKREGIYQYWLDTKTQPDMCETPDEREFEVCRELRKDQGR